MKRYILKNFDKLAVPEEAADLNGDGRINSTDLSILHRYLLRHNNEFFPLNNSSIN